MKLNNLLAQYQSFYYTGLIDAKFFPGNKLLEIRSKVLEVSKQNTNYMNPARVRQHERLPRKKIGGM